MPTIEVVFYRDVDGTVPLIEWLCRIPAKARDKCIVALERLEDHGHELRRPIADCLRDGVYELRVALHGRNYRMLYFFHGRTAAIVSHGLVKEQIIPPKEIDRTIERKRAFERNPQARTFRPEDMP